MPLNYAKVWNVNAKEAKDSVVIDYLLWIDVEGDFQTEYQEGETFNPAGMKVIAHFADGSDRELGMTDKVEWKYIPNSSLTAKDDHITVYYSYFNKTATARVPITVIKNYAKIPYVLEDKIVYNGQKQSPTIINEDSDYVKIEGTLIGDAAGDYSFRATITVPNVVFEGTEDKTSMDIIWTIEKAPRPVNLSLDQIYFDDSNTQVNYNVYLNYPGTQPYNRREKLVGAVSSPFYVQYYNNEKYFTIQSYPIVSNARLEIEFWVPGDDNYLESEHVTFSAITLYWEWGDEYSTANADVADDLWVDGLMNQVRVGGVNKEWLGKKKVFRFTNVNGGDNPIVQFDGQSKIQFTCVGANKDAPDSLTFISSYTPGLYGNQGNGTCGMNLKKEHTLAYGVNGEHFEELTQDPNVMNSLYFFLFYQNKDNPDASFNYMDKNFPAPEYLIKKKRRYWTGLNLEEIEQGFFIPSAGELGITNDDIATYIGGQGVEFGEGVRQPYDYFIDNSRRKTVVRTTNSPTKYWTRSTADDGVKAGNTGINVDMIIIDENGAPATLDKTNSTTARFLIMFTIGLSQEEGASA